MILLKRHDYSVNSSSSITLPKGSRIALYRPGGHGAVYQNDLYTLRFVVRNRRAYISRLKTDYNLSFMRVIGFRRTVAFLQNKETPSCFKLMI